MDDAKVLIRGKVFLYREKAPFVPSGESIRGALEFNETDQTVRCHECGGWFQAVGRHIKGHGITAREYKLKHGLRAVSALISESVRAQLIKQGQGGFGVSRLMDPAVRLRSAAGAAEYMRSQKGARRPHATEVKNEDGRCHAQLMQDLLATAARVGHTPSIAELLEGPHGDGVRGIQSSSLLMSFNVKSLSDVMDLVGLKPNEFGGPAKSRGGKGTPGAPRIFNKAICIEMLRDFWAKHGRLPSPSDRRRGVFPTHMTINKLFGSMFHLYREAGFENEAQRMRSERASVAGAAAATARRSVDAATKSAWAFAGHESRRRKRGAAL